ncbi:MAG: efflux RND transporter periplasmic adaptor subunit [Candidatus Paceibacterota bacterium]|jgi:HlyD family secretion protein
MKMKLGKKRIIAVIIAVLSIFAIYQLFFAKKQETFNYEEVKKTNISQEVSVSGKVKKGEDLGLNFNASGKLKKIYVEVGDEVEEGKKLAELDSSQLFIQFQSASAQLKTAEIGLEKLLAGAGQEDIALTRTALQNAQSSHQSAQQKYADVKNLADTTLDNLYKSSLSSLADSILEVYNSLNFLQSSSYVVDSRDLAETRAEIEKMDQYYQDGKNYLAQAQASSTVDNIGLAIEKTKKTLEISRDSALKIRSFWEARSSATAAQKTSLDAHQGYLNASLSGVVSIQNNIALTKTTNQSNINTAWSVVVSAQGQMDIAQENLNKLLALPRQEDIDLAEAQVSQAQAQANLLSHQINESTIKSPVKGKIAQVNKKEGEQAQGAAAGQDFIVLIPKEPFQVEINIPEVDIGQVNLEDPCQIDLDAFSDEQFFGKVIKIDPAETVIAGVVYYKTTISLNSEDQKIRPGMTANVIVITESKENVLTVPQRAVFEKAGKKLVRIIEGENLKEVEVQTGLKGVQGEVEIISGLKEGDKVVTFLKES